MTCISKLTKVNVINVYRTKEYILFAIIIDKWNSKNPRLSWISTYFPSKTNVEYFFAVIHWRSPFWKICIPLDVISFSYYIFYDFMRWFWSILRNSSSIMMKKNLWHPLCFLDSDCICGNQVRLYGLSLDRCVHAGNTFSSWCLLVIIHNTPFFQKKIHIRCIRNSYMYPACIVKQR